jgi:hypothetical protein
VSRAHIDVLVQALCESELVIEDPTEVGRELWNENVNSIHDRYPDTLDGGTYPGPIGFSISDVAQYSYRRPSAHLPREFVIQQAHCYSYQTCEHAGWITSRAAAWITLLYEALDPDGSVYSKIPASCPWGAEESHVHPKVGV